MSASEPTDALEEITRLLIRLCSSMEHALVALIDLRQEQREMKALIELLTEQR